MHEKLKKMVYDFVEDYKIKNRIKTDWRKPLVAFAYVNDPLFLQLKQLIGEFHKVPTEMMKEAKTVITYFIPFNKRVVSSNANGKSCSKEWAIAYVETNKLIVDLNDYLYFKLSEQDFKSVLIPPTYNFNKLKLMSYWSHKHAAYISGLGKFGLHKMLITEKGCCGRLGSLITSAKISATERKNEEYCLYYENESCKKCLEKCVFNALRIFSFDRYKCYSVLLKNGELFARLGLTDICGKCACGVPCSLIKPVRDN